MEKVDFQAENDCSVRKNDRYERKTDFFPFPGCFPGSEWYIAVNSNIKQGSFYAENDCQPFRCTETACRGEMEMSLIAFVLILASVVLHALWHFISKSRKPVPAFFLLVSGACLCTTLPFALTSGIDFHLLPGRFWLMVLGGAFCGVVCDIGLSCAYRRADVSLAYPLARALPVLMTAFLTILFGIGKNPAPMALFGMLVIMIGCVMMPMKSFSDLHWKNYWNKALLGVFTAALGTTGYTIFDSEGVRLLYECEPIPRWHGAATYSCIRESCLASMLLVYVLCVPHERAQITKDLFLHPHPYLAGVFAGIAYLLVLIAMGFVSNVSFIQAFRQMSLPVGVILGILFLKEKCLPTKLAGVVLVVAGLIITATA